MNIEHVGLVASCILALFLIGLAWLAETSAPNLTRETLIYKSDINTWVKP